jgi:hypothetical protein
MELDQPVFQRDRETPTGDSSALHGRGSKFQPDGASSWKALCHSYRKK